MTPAMRYRRFGRTGLSLPVISCGGMRFQHRWQDVPFRKVPSEVQANLEATVHRAFELGINHFETARGYGSSEMQLGRVLPGLPRDRIIVQTKVEPQSSARAFRKVFDRSMGYLGLDHVDLLGFHGVNTRDILNRVLRPGGSLAAAREIQREGRARFVGFSTHATPDIVLEAIETGEFDYVNLHWYFVNDLTWPAVEAARRRDMGVFIISPNDKGGHLHHPPPKLSRLCAPLTPMQFNDLFCLSREQVHTLSCGASRPSDFDEHVAALEHYDRIPEVVGPIEQRLRAELERVHGADWCGGWWTGLPSYLDVPGQINVVEILRIYTYAKALDLTDWAKARYNLLGQANHWFPGETAEKLARYDLQPVLRGTPFADRIPGLLAEAHQALAGAPQTRLSQRARTGVLRSLRRLRERLRR